MDRSYPCGSGKSWTLWGAPNDHSLRTLWLGLLATAKTGADLHKKTRFRCLTDVQKHHMFTCNENVFSSRRLRECLYMQMVQSMYFSPHFILLENNSFLYLTQIRWRSRLCNLKTTLSLFAVMFCIKLLVLNDKRRTE